MNCGTLEVIGHSSSDSAIKSAVKSSNVGTARTNFTVPQPFALATEKRATVGNQPIAYAARNGTRSDDVNDQDTQNLVQKTQAHSSPTSRKSLQPDNLKHPGEEDACSVASSTTASVGKLKIRTTIPSAPIFRCPERAQKRKEFYSKLEEKHQAIEAERLQNEARQKEEREAAIKQLRKSLIIKANPLPSFYREGPPPKVELKKPPPTRAKSPKLGRRKSCSDGTNPSQGENDNGVCSRLNRHSLGSSYMEDTNNHRTAKIGISAHKDKEGPKLERETSKPLSHKAKGQEEDADINVES